MTARRKRSADPHAGSGVNREVEKMDVKKWYHSGTIQGALLILALAGLKMSGVTVDEMGQIYDYLLDIGQAAAGVWVIISRITARTRLE